MRFMAMVGAFCALSQTALAQNGDCRLIADAPARLACYDKASAASRPAAARPAAAAPAKLPASKADGKYVDAISAEDALMTERLRNICRGC